MGIGGRGRRNGAWHLRAACFSLSPRSLFAIFGRRKKQLLDNECRQPSRNHFSFTQRNILGLEIENDNGITEEKKTFPPALKQTGGGVITLVLSKGHWLIKGRTEENHFVFDSRSRIHKTFFGLGSVL